MPIPQLDDRGFLPPGIHDCTMTDIRAEFGRFNRSDRRPQLFQKLEQFVAEVSRSRVATALVVNGSFTTAKPDPDDIDMVLVLPSGHDFTSNVSPDEYNLLSKRRVRKRYGFDIFVAEDGSAEFTEYTGFFQQVKEQPGRQKGVLRIAV